ncbi:MAG: zinc-ribbon domain-containing protein [Acutalibacteraceae bacterium]
MKCNNCGNEIVENSAFCTFCGSPVSPTEPTEAPTSAVKQKILNIFKDKLFLVLCILVSVATVFSIASKNIPLLLILFTIFLWLIYAKATKNEVDIKNMRCVSGTVFAAYVLNWVLIGFLGFATVIGAIITLAIGSTAEFESIMQEVLSEYAFSVNGFDSLLGLTTASIMIIAVVAFIMLFVICVIAAIVNIFGMRSIHKFAKSLYISAEIDNFCIEKLNAAKSWLLVLGIFNCISALPCIDDFKAFITSGCLGAAYILAYILIKKHFFQPQQLN